MRRDTVWLCGSTTHTAGRPSVSVSALAGTSTPGGADSRMRPVTVAPSSHGLGRIRDADLDLKRSGRSVGLRRNLPHPAGRLHLRIAAEGDLDLRVARTGLNELLRDVEHGVAAALTCKLHNRLPGVDDFPRLGADRGDGARGVGEQSRVALLFPSGPQLRLRGVDLRLGA